MKCRTTVWAVEIGGWIILGFGALVAVLNLPALNWLIGAFIDLAFWPFDGAQTAEPQAARLLAAMLGGIACGWGVLQIGLARAWDEHDTDRLGTIAIRAYLTWFVVDSAGSVMAGAPANLVGNTLFLLALLAPFYLGRRSAAEA